MGAMDVLDIDNAPEPTDDGTPSDSVNEIFLRMRNTITKIENTYGGGDFIIVGGDSTVLSVFAAAACGVDLRNHARFELRPGEFFDLPDLQRQVKAGEYVPPEMIELSAEQVKRGRDYLDDEIGAARLFSESAAGSCLCCACER